MMPLLAPYAAHPEQSKGREVNETSPEFRTEYQRDRDRIVHSAAFRRLEYKTQVFVNHEGDMFRTRLTHSIEVAQIARSVARSLALNEDLSEAIALAHDLGHTPFGHAGQDALQQCMQAHGGFEHNLQSLRIVDVLETHYLAFSGLNLTYETREGILKHCAKNKAKALGDIGQRFIQRQQPSLEAQLTNLSDEIAYNNHDIDDGLRSGLIDVDMLCQVALFNEQYQGVVKAHPQQPIRRVIHETVRRMINQQVLDLTTTSQQRLNDARLESIQAVREHGKPLIVFSDSMQAKNQALKQFLRKHLYNHYRVHRMSVKATRIIKALFEAFYEDSALLPEEAQQRMALSEDTPARVVADYIAGMTDRYAILEYGRVFDVKI